MRYIFLIIIQIKNRRPQRRRSAPAPYYHHLQARGKTKMQALVATMRKLLHAIFGMFKHDQLFDGHKVYAAVDEAVSAPQEVLCT